MGAKKNVCPPHTHTIRHTRLNPSFCLAINLSLEFTTEKRNLVPNLLQTKAQCPSCTLPSCWLSSNQKGTCDQTIDLTSLNDEGESREDEMQHVEREEEKAPPDPSPSLPPPCAAVSITLWRKERALKRAPRSYHHHLSNRNKYLIALISLLTTNFTTSL